MLKKLTLIVILLVFAKPAYDFITELLNEPSVSESYNSDMETPEQNTFLNEQQSSNIAQQEQSNSQSVNERTAEVTDPKQEDVPKWIDSTEDLADAFYYYYSRFETNFEIHYVGSTKNIEAMIQEATAMAAARNDFVGGHIAGHEMRYEYSKMDAIIKVEQRYLTNLAEIEAVKKWVAQVIEQNNVQSMSQYDQIKFVNDVIVINTVYSENTVASPHSAFAVAYEGKGVCQGYALLAQEMFNQLGIESKYIVGEVEGQGHAWNLIKLDGNWYHLDVTWNDPTPDRGNKVRYGYFLVSDRFIAKDHTWIQGNYPAAVSETFANMNES